MGVVGCFLMLYPQNEVEMVVTLMYRSSVIPIAAGWLIALYIALDIWGVVSGGGGGVAYLSHVAGAGFGIGTTWLMLKMGWLKSAKLERNLLQVWGLMPEEEVAPVAVEKKYVDRSKVVSWSTPPAHMAVPRREPKEEKPLPPIELD